MAHFVKGIQKGDQRRRLSAPRLRTLISLWRPVLRWSLAAGLVVHGAGCTRGYYRKEADKEVSEVLAQKDKYPAWAIENWHIYPDPRARFNDQGALGDPDHPPKPPDDPAAYALSPNPQKPGKAGIARVEGTGYLDLIVKWDKENRERRAKEDEEEKKKAQEPPLDGEEEEDEVALPNPALPAAPVPAVAAAPPAFLPDVPPKASGLSGLAIAKQAPADAQPPGTAKPAIPGVPEGVKGPNASTNARDILAEVKSRSSLDFDGRKAFLITLDQAAELAMFNSREYQDQRENLYLAALPVTQERFSFTTQLFAAQEAFREYAGRNTLDGQSSNWTLNNGTGFSKVLSTGALLLLNFSNQTVFNFLNPKQTISVTSLDFSAIQPLLQGGGQAVALETLTQAERDLLYQIRSYARFRKELYVEIASNNGGSINGASFQPTGVLGNQGTSISIALGNSGLNPGVPVGVGFPITQAILPPASPGTLSLSPALTPAPSGYLNTMLQKIQVYIDKENIDVLGDILLRYRGLLEGDIVAPLQVQSVEQQLLAGRVTLVSDQQDYLDSIDSFKIELGVPVDLDIEVEDTQLRPLLKQFARERAIIENEQNTVAQASALTAPDQILTLRASLERLLRTSVLVRKTKFATAIAGRLEPWQKLSDVELRVRLDAIRKETQALLDRQTDLVNQGKALSSEELLKLRELNSQADLGTYEAVLRKYLADYIENGQPKKLDAAGERRRVNQFRDVISYWQKILVEARDERLALVRADWPELPRCCVDGVDLVNDDLELAHKTASRYAILHRLDLMNIRAQLVDSWRQLAIYANALLGVFNVAYNLQANSPLHAAQPTNIGGSGTSNQLVINTQLPIVRLQQRNNYRAALIAYSRQRRALEEGEDLASQVVRFEINNLRVYAENYKIQQRQLELAYITIDSSLESLQSPTPPGPVRTGQDGPAALTSQLLTAQRTLPTAQNGLLTIWINYLDLRLQLFRDLELMPLDARGVWIDEIRACDCSLQPEQSPGGNRAATGTEKPTPTGNQAPR
jgi:hypothetical protein